MITITINKSNTLPNSWKWEVTVPSFYLDGEDFKGYGSSESAQQAGVEVAELIQWLQSTDNWRKFDT